jgi:hypothetical protein
VLTLAFAHFAPGFDFFQRAKTAQANIIVIQATGANAGSRQRHLGFISSSATGNKQYYCNLKNHCVPML